MRDVLDALIEALERREPAILGVVTRSSGSAPRSVGARMLVQADGSLIGSVGGGSVEQSCLAEAKHLFARPAAFSKLSFTLTATAAAEEGMICGGTVDILLHKVQPEEIGLLHELARLCRQAPPPLLLTLLPNATLPCRMLLLSPLHNAGLDAALQRDLLARNCRKPYTLSHQGQEILVEPLLHRGTVHLAGAGHVALATAHLADFVGFDVVVLDDRAEFANRERFAQARQVLVVESFQSCLPDLETDDYLVIVTRGHQHDRDVLSQALRTTVGYIGMIGSSRKRKAVYSSLLEEGFSEADLKRVSCPIGLAIGADTPEEIALSIVAELVQVRAGRRQ